MNVRSLLTLIGCGLLQGSAFGDTAGRWNDRVKRASDQRAFEPVLAEERGRAQELFGKTFRDGYSEELVKDWASLAMELTREKNGKETLLWLRESTETKRGRGCFVMRPGRTRQVALECPHSFKDLSTRKIGVAWMLEGKFGAAAFNTVPRSFEDESGKSVYADMAKEGSTYFMAFTLAWARTHKEGAIVQLHGFARGKRQSASGKRSSVIVSSSRKDPSPEVRAFAKALRSTVKGPVYVYPLDVRELGGTLNVQAIGLRYLGFERFIHLEVCQEERARLLSDEPYRMAWLQCLEVGLRGGTP